MTETASEFKARVQRLRKLYPEWREGQAVWNAIGFYPFGNKEQVMWARETFRQERKSGQRVAYCWDDDSRIPAFIAAAVKAGVLRADL